MPKQSWPEQDADNSNIKKLTRDQESPGESSAPTSQPNQEESQYRETGSSRLYPSVINDPLHPIRENQNHSNFQVCPNWYQGRRWKAALALTLIWGGITALHFVSWGMGFILGLTGLLSIHAIRIFSAKIPSLQLTKPVQPQHNWPYISLLVAAKNEEAVISQLVKNLCNLDYPSDCYELWIVDDNSSDKTPIVLEKLSQDYPQLKVLRRSANASGGKSGALNQVLALTQGEIIGVFDADAQIAPDMLRHIVPIFYPESVGAVQVRKAINNASENFWTRSQAAEMALDAYFQEKRISMGGIGELRGNGQFVRREALLSCGGWNEETITDDLDLTIRLHLDQWDIECLSFPPVYEEGVTNFKALWHQRNRWAEGGYQRYLDYWQLILSNRMGTQKTLDLFCFWITQYILPTAVVPDLVLSLIQGRLPLTTPLTCFTLTLSLLGMFLGLRRIRQTQGTMVNVSPELVSTHSSKTSPPLWEKLTIGIDTLRGTVYMLHWLLVVGSTTIRMGIRPKQLKWVKTVHQGNNQ
ncbi:MULTISPECIES: glycosyltransferase [Planktothrix]|jgi:1,2-diacylglycerol 3-beta-glucosyltransferase|uniref:Beta-monoglucosyldiacylglycerol synthase n=1 Tax=Planktothrix rubescens CCAP 1459/22 TaxID=329571 RepID=A0A6J7ZRX6_PLARU|nr:MULTISPECIES: glycosyltransferase family 2 protein [Planktothrix]CAC5345212.1 Beta-monoglucosyldiacylglycerol synthase [Planktothrix rubescens NIVA-CYA 18]CAD5909452.1 Beta-monoglucosyldiacylglycerol synthase [Planktothrix rubescens]CAD5962404.1 Beta-monoglucosyldiacylglycerol synthase [Planktothrix rubescens NIVA-CYA 18]CAH2573758.1 Beta-monoglucosyldiacylglycerol synthase [Planktothrix rubescens]